MYIATKYQIQHISLVSIISYIAVDINSYFFWCQEAFKTNWISWFNDSLMIPQSLCFSTQNDLLLIGTCSGILTVIPTKLILSESGTVQHGSKKVRVVKAKDEAEIGRRAMPVSISWWATNESKALAIVGTNHGLVIIIDLVDGKEVSLLQNMPLYRGLFINYVDKSLLIIDHLPTPMENLHTIDISSTTYLPLLVKAP